MRDVMVGGGEHGRVLMHGGYDESVMVPKGHNESVIVLGEEVLNMGGHLERSKAYIPISKKYTCSKLDGSDSIDHSMASEIPSEKFLIRRFKTETGIVLVPVFRKDHLFIKSFHVSMRKRFISLLAGSDIQGCFVRPFKSEGMMMKKGS
ncbi:hypothetical protein AgCh_019370 [Apium graveolens]